jgi:hypothetical protein
LAALTSRLITSVGTASRLYPLRRRWIASSAPVVIAHCFGEGRGRRRKRPALDRDKRDLAYNIGICDRAVADTRQHGREFGRETDFKQGKITGTISYNTSTVAATFGGKTYEGTLRIDGDQICTKYPKIKKGAETCFGISKTAKGYKTTHGATLWP